jgi:hypothetical protein
MRLFLRFIMNLREKTMKLEHPRRQAHYDFLALDYWITSSFITTLGCFGK